MRSKFFAEIKNAVIERQVEDVYNKGLGIYFNNAPISYPYACDGFIETKTDNDKELKLLVEYKFDKNFENSLDRAKVILQTIYYVKQFEINGKELPNVILIADKNECFVLHTNSIIKYLDCDIDWKIAPSNASEKYIDLCIEISNDENINSSFIYSVDDNFSFKIVADNIKDYADNVKRYVHITENNIVNIFETFTKKVLSKNVKLSPNDLVGLFIGVISDKVNFYLHPNKKNTLITSYGEVKVKNDGYNQFINNFSRDYSVIEKRKFTEISDRLIEDTNRRNKGEFYTPKLFVDYAHKMIEEHLGADWKEKYVVWDNSCGTKNLTKDYNFKELYCSTLENAELEMSKKYNANSVSFVFDFLNDSLEKLPKGLLEAFEQNKPIVFFLNPPYATSGNIGETSKEGISKTSLYNTMKENGIGRCISNLYCQFLYRIMLIKKQYDLTNCYIALFSPTLYLSGTAWKTFRNEWFNNFNFNNACTFKASHFADCADNWGISFSLWNNGVSEEKQNFNHTLIDVENNTIVENGVKNIYNLDYTKTCGEWTKELVKKEKTFDAPNFTNGITIKQECKSKTNQLGKIANNAIGFLYANSNCVDKNMQFVGLFSSAMSDGVGCSILPQNFERCNTYFTARKLIEKTWINSKDEYIAPNEEHPQWKQFVADSVVYSLFHSASNQSSLRQVEYKGKKWDIKNEFFFMSKENMLDLSNEIDNEDMYNDCSASEERFVYTWLKEHYSELSDKAKEVLEMAKELVSKSMKYRQVFDEENEEYQINNWDCGFYQIKAMLKQYMPNELKAFNELYKSFAEQLRPMVYELGFLK
jgi:hypothetical protein